MHQLSLWNFLKQNKDFQEVRPYDVARDLAFDASELGNKFLQTTYAILVAYIINAVRVYQATSNRNVGRSSVYGWLSISTRFQDVRKVKRRRTAKNARSDSHYSARQLSAQSPICTEMHIKYSCRLRGDWWMIHETWEKPFWELLCPIGDCLPFEAYGACAV